MNNYRQPPRGRRQTMDGILGAPSRPQLTGRQFSARPLRGNDLRTTSRPIGDFKRPAGYHAANSPLGSPRFGATKQSGPAMGEGEASLLDAALGDGKQSGGLVGVTPHKKKRNWHKIRKYTFRGGLATLGVLLLLGGFLFAKGFFNLNKVFKGGGSAAALNSNVSPSLLRGEGDGRVNMLLLGRGGEGHEGADLTDTLLVASIDPVNKKAALVSLPRDFWVTTPQGSSKVNAVFANAKERALMKSGDKKKAEESALGVVQKEVTEVLGVPIHYYGIVDFSAFKKAVDTVGGVDMNISPQTAVTEKLFDETTRRNYYLDVRPGLQHFDGQKALFYTRSRHASPRGDFDRAERQRLFIEALAQKVVSVKTFSNPVKVSQLMDTFGSHVATDMSRNDAMRMLQIGKGIGKSYDSVDLADPVKPLVKTGMISGQSVVMPAAGPADYSEIQALVRSKLKDGYLVRENANITILNGTSTPGLASEKADQLKSYGYNVGTVTDAPRQDYQETVVVDLTKGKKPYTKNYLQKRFGVKIAKTLPDQSIKPGTANFVIILGNNETINR